MVEATVGVEVVILARELVRRPVEAVVKCCEESMFASRERAGLKFQASVWTGMDAEVAAVNLKTPAQAHAIDHKPGVVHRSFKGEGAAIEARAALQEPLRHRVVASWHDHRVRRREGGAGSLLNGLAFLEAEVPASAEIKFCLLERCGH